MVKECLVFLDIEVENMDEFLELTADMIFETNLIENRDEFHAALVKREQEITTGVGKGVAFPHSSGSFVKYPFVALFRLKNPIDYQSIDGRPVDLFFVIGTPTNAEKTHLKILSRLAQNFAESEFRLELRECDDADLIVRVLRRIFQPMVIVVTENEDEKLAVLRKFSPHINFFFYNNGIHIEPFEIHISDLALAINKDAENRLINGPYSLDEAINEIDSIYKVKTTWEEDSKWETYLIL